MKKSEYAATIYNGHCHIERRVYEDDMGNRYVKINGVFFDIDCDLEKYDVEVWYTGKDSIC
jgi:hypothetical protein